MTKFQELNYLDYILLDLYPKSTPPETAVWSKEFYRSACTEWALDTYKKFIDHWFHQSNDYDLDELISATEQFYLKMSEYSRHNHPNTKMVFETASEVIFDVLDILEAMRCK